MKLGSAPQPGEAGIDSAGRSPQWWAPRHKGSGPLIKQPSQPEKTLLTTADKCASCGAACSLCQRVQYPVTAASLGAAVLVGRIGYFEVRVLLARVSVAAALRLGECDNPFEADYRIHLFVVSIPPPTHRGMPLGTPPSASTHYTHWAHSPCWAWLAPPSRPRQTSFASSEKQWKTDQARSSTNSTSMQQECAERLSARNAAVAAVLRVFVAAQPE